MWKSLLHLEANACHTPPGKIRVPERIYRIVEILFMCPAKQIVCIGIDAEPGIDMV